MSVYFETFNEAFPAILAGVLDEGDDSSPRGMSQREIMGLAYEIGDVSDPIIVAPEGVERGIDYEYAEAFADFVLSGAEDMPESLIKMKPFAANFDWKRANEDLGQFELPPNFSAFYGPRIHQQLNHVIEEMKRDPDTRRAFVSVLYGEQDNYLLQHAASGDFKNFEYPCTVGFHFLIREGALNMSVMMRSQNMAGILPFDWYIAAKFMQLVAGELGIPTGVLNGFVSSAHIYQRDFDWVKKWVEAAGY